MSWVRFSSALTAARKWITRARGSEKKRACQFRCSQTKLADRKFRSAASRNRLQFATAPVPDRRFEGGRVLCYCSSTLPVPIESCRAAWLSTRVAWWSCPRVGIYHRRTERRLAELVGIFPVCAKTGAFWKKTQNWGAVRSDELSDATAFVLCSTVVILSTTANSTLQ